MKLKENFKCLIEIESEYRKYTKDKGLINYTSPNVYYVNEVGELYYFLLLNSPELIAREALSFILDLGLYYYYEYVPKGEDVTNWINNITREEYYVATAKILAKHPNLVNVEMILEEGIAGFYCYCRIPIEESPGEYKHVMAPLSKIDELFNIK